MNLTKIFFDTNVLVYAHDKDSSFHTDSATLLQLVFSSKVKGIIAEQNIIELYRVLTNSVAMKKKPLTSVQAVNLISQTYRSGIFDVIYPNSLTTNTVLQLAINGNVTSAKIFDTRLAAMIIHTDADYLATYNVKHFKDIEGVNPLTPKKILADLLQQ